MSKRTQSKPTAEADQHAKNAAIARGVEPDRSGSTHLGANVQKNEMPPHRSRGPRPLECIIHKRFGPDRWMTKIMGMRVCDIEPPHCSGKPWRFAVQSKRRPLRPRTQCWWDARSRAPCPFFLSAREACPAIQSTLRLGVEGGARSPLRVSWPLLVACQCRRHVPIIFVHQR